MVLKVVCIGAWTSRGGLVVTIKPSIISWSGSPRNRARHSNDIEQEKPHSKHGCAVARQAVGLQLADADKTNGQMQYHHVQREAPNTTH